MTRCIRIALIVLCVIGCLGAVFAVSSASADLPATSDLISNCPRGCLTDGNLCTFDSDCPQYPGFTMRCCTGVCAFCG